MKKFDFCLFCNSKMEFGGKGEWVHLDCDFCMFWTDLDDDDQIVRIAKCDPFGKDRKFERNQLEEFERLLKLKAFQ